MPCFFCITGDVVLKKAALRSHVKSINMLNFEIKIICSDNERLCRDCKEKAQILHFVRGHFRVIEGKKVYVKPHYRKR